MNKTIGQERPRLHNKVLNTFWKRNPFNQIPIVHLEQKRTQMD